MFKYKFFWFSCLTHFCLILIFFYSCELHKKNCIWKHKYHNYNTKSTTLLRQKVYILSEILKNYLCKHQNQMATRKDKIIVTFLLANLLVLIANILFGHDRRGSSTSEFPREKWSPVTSDLLDGCYHIYLDVGTNVGVQVRKVFEPISYPDAPVLEVFEKEFGQPWSVIAFYLT